MRVCLFSTHSVVFLNVLHLLHFPFSPSHLNTYVLWCFKLTTSVDFHQDPFKNIMQSSNEPHRRWAFTSKYSAQRRLSCWQNTDLKFKEKSLRGRKFCAHVNPLPGSSFGCRDIQINRRSGVNISSSIWPLLLHQPFHLRCLLFCKWQEASRNNLGLSV